MSAKPTLVSIRRMTSLSDIAEGMTHVFQDAQMTLSGHRKLVVLLRSIQVRAISIGYEQMFNFQFIKLISKILKLRKGIPAADRIAKFCSVVVATILKEEAESPTARPNGDISEDGDELESVGSEFVDNLIRHLLRGIESKFKEVRYRVVQLLAYLVNYITEIDEQLFKALHYSLNRRLYDREPMVRIQAVVAISRFQYFLGDDELNSATKALLVSLKHDDSPEVRRAALLNLAKNPSTLPELMLRARDTNAINRRLVYSRLLREMSGFGDISADLREQLLNWGLNDRDITVKTAAEVTISKTWLGWAHDDILELIEHLRVVDSKVAETAMDVLFRLKLEKLDAVEITPQTWKELTVEKAFFIRTYFDYCNHHKLYDNIEKNIPELTNLAAMLQDYLKLRSSMLSANKDLVERHMAHVGRLERFALLLKNTDLEHREVARKVAKESAYMYQLSDHADEVQNKLAEKRARSKKLNDTVKNRKSPSEALVHEASEVRMEVKDLETALDEAKAAVDQYTAMVEQQQKRLAELSKIAAHQSDERDAYVASNSDLENEYAPFGEQLRELEFIIEQLLLVIRGSDFADVAGTRRLMPIITNALTNDILTDQLIDTCVQILRRISADENYFLGLCTEIITDIRDSASDENDETFVSAVSMFGHDDDDDDDENDNDTDGGSSKRRKIAPALPPDNLLIQCLMVLQRYLENVDDTLSNIHQLDSMIDTLIRPAISNNVNPTIRLLGYRTLGLFSLIDKGLGTSNLKFFGMSASKTPDEELKILSTKILFDVLSTHGVGILSDDGEDSVDSLSLARLFYSLLKAYEMPALQAVVAEGLCKLFLADLLVDFGKGDVQGDSDTQQESQLLEVLLLSYFHPLNAANHELKQTLAFCIPVYAFSHESHQAKVSAVSGDCFYRLFSANSDFAGHDNLSAPGPVIQQLIYWCDPNNLVNVSPEDVRRNPSHFWQAMHFLQVVEQDTPKAVKKTVISNLGKLSLSEDLGSELLGGLKRAIDDTRQLVSSKQLDAEFVFDAPTEKALDKFQAFVGDLVAKAVEVEANAPVRSRTGSVHEVKIEEEDEVRGEEEEERENIVVESEDEMVDAEGVVEEGKEVEAEETEMHQDEKDANTTQKGEIDEIEKSTSSPKMEQADKSNLASEAEIEAEMGEGSGAEINSEAPKEELPAEKYAKPAVPDLAEIDQFLEDEDQVEYDLSMD